MALTPHARLRKWMKKTSTTQSGLARDLDCTPAFTSMLCHSPTALPGRLIANKIERLTANWIHGPIRSEEWDAIELRKIEAAKKKRAA